MSLLSYLKSEPKARKIFGEKELKIVEKQLLGISLTQSEKNRLSRDIRPKFEFISDVSRFSGNFKLKKGAEIKRIIDESKEEILHDKISKRIERIFLFGSTVENKRHYHSDIDLAVKFSKINLKEATLFRKHVLGRVRDCVDIQVYNVLPEKIKKEIRVNGRRIYSKDNAENKGS